MPNNQFTRELFEPKLSVNWRRPNLLYFRREDCDISINIRQSDRPKRGNRAFSHTISLSHGEPLAVNAPWDGKKTWQPGGGVEHERGSEPSAPLLVNVCWC